MRDFAADPPLAVRVTGVGRTFGPPRGLARPSRGAFGRMLRGILGLKVPPMRKTSMAAGDVLKDLSFEIAEGSVVCIAGASSSAKSALLRLLAGVVPPATGRIEMRGPVASILEIGDNLELTQTALENIENQRRLKRIAAADAEDYAAQVIAFAELGGFERVPVRKYSTGMQVRLSLALALQGHPAVVLMDDVLGVGDASFQKKCVDRLLALKAAGCTLVIAPGDEGLMQQMATRVLTLGDGGIIADGPPRSAPCQPLADEQDDVVWNIASCLPENEFVALKRLGLAKPQDGKNVCVRLSLACEIKIAPQRCRPLITVARGKAAVFRSIYPSFLQADERGPVRFTVDIPIDLLPRGHYTIDVAVVSERKSVVHALKADAAVVLDVTRASHEVEGGSPKPLVTPDLPWEIEPVAEGGL